MSIRLLSAVSAALLLALSPLAQAQSASAPAATASAAAPAAKAPAAKASTGDSTEGKVAYYGRKFAGRKTASGERFNPGALTMAHKSLTAPARGAPAPQPPDDQPAGLLSAASATASAVMLTMRRTVALGVKMCTGRAAPSSTGPTVTPWPPVIFSTLKRMLAASKFGSTSKFAAPLSVVSGR